VASGTAFVGVGVVPAGAANAPSTDRVSSNFALAVGPSAQLTALSEPGCHLGNGVQHVFYIGFDNFHLRRDNSNNVANNGDNNHNTDTNIPSDLEQVPHLYDFLKNNGTVLTNHHTPLISHTSVDFTAAYTGVYGDQNGIATTQNGIAAYGNGAGTASVRGNGGFGFWTDPLGIGTAGAAPPAVNANTFNTPLYVTKDQNNSVVNAPAPWVPFTRAGCDVGAVAATTMVLENQTSVNALNNTMTSLNPPQPGSFTTNDVGLAVHCAAGTFQHPGGLCSLAGNFNGTDQGVTAAPDDLPKEPPAGSYGDTTGYYALFGHKSIAPALNDRLQGLTSGGSTTLGLLRPNVSATGFSTSFNGDDGNYTLGYTLAMQEAGIPVTFGYLTTAHNCYAALDGSTSQTTGSSAFLTSQYDDYNPGGSVPTMNPCNHTDAGTTTDSGTSSSFGSGEQGYVNYLAQLDSDFNTFFMRAQADGYTPANSVFVFYSDENDHVSEATPANGTPTSSPQCDGVKLACQYDHSSAQTTPNTPGQLGEVTVKLEDTPFPAAGTTSPPSPAYFNLNDSAPDFYVTGTSSGPPSQTDPSVRGLERSIGSFTYSDPYDNTTKNLASYEVDQAGMNAVHMITQDPYRSPTFDVFAPGEDFVESGFPNDCGATGNTTLTCSNAGFPYVHGDFAPETNTTWAGLVGPGVAHLTTSSVWTDHTDLRTTVLALTGLQDDYTDAGRVITQILTPTAVSPALTNQTATDLGTLLKKLNAPVYMSSEGANDGFGPAIIVADTSALKSGDANSDATYTDVEGKIVNITAQRNTVVADIQARLTGAANGMTIDPPGAAADESFGQCILTYANQLKTYAADPTPANAPTDCGTPAILPESSHAVLLIVGGGAVMAGALLLVGRRRRMRHRLS
jgi:hypothetical protein